MGFFVACPETSGLVCIGAAITGAVALGEVVFREAMIWSLRGPLKRAERSPRGVFAQFGLTGGAPTESMP